MNPKQKEKGHSPASSGKARKAAVLAGIALAAAAAFLAFWWMQSPVPPAPVSSNPPPQPQTTNVAGGTNPTRPEFQKLVGSWLRPDGGYILQIRSVDGIGVVDAAYFNPDPIHVSKAAAFVEGGETRVFIELKDVNYPGCTYTLVYDPAANRLAGDYFQAALGEHFEVEFVPQR